MPLTDAEKQRRAADKKESKGLVRICKWGTPKQKTGFEAVLRGEAEIVYKPGEKK